MITIYKDTAANAIFLEDANGAQFLNSLQAVVDEVGGSTLSITDLAKTIELVSKINYTEIVDENQNSYGNNAIDVVNELNAIFAASGTPSQQAPVITSSLAISLVEGQTLNYELTADYGVGYEWDFSNVPGVTNVNGNMRKIIGGSSLAVLGLIIYPLRLLITMTRTAKQ